MTEQRRAELADNLARVQDRIASACAAAGRSAEEVTLIVVTKFFPASDVAHLLDLGVRDIGESRDQEAGAKVDELRDLTGDTDELVVHFVGQLQRNKAASVSRYADVVHSVDRERLATALERGAARHDRILDVLVQVDLDPDPDPDRGGVGPDDVSAVAAAIVGLDHVRLRGVMSVAPPKQDPAAAFARLAEVSARLRGEHRDASWISAGMSGDLESAVAHGATHLRVGTAILGSRPSHR